jgi:hypothetical protein
MKDKFVETDNNEALIQASEFSFRRQMASDTDRLDLAYRQLWLYRMHHYKSMPPPAKSEDELLVKRDCGELDERVLCEMAGLARRLGFWSTEINNLLQRSPDRLIARQCSPASSLPLSGGNFCAFAPVATITAILPM